jgi:hypothetical protein
MSERYSLCDKCCGEHDPPCCDLGTCDAYPTSEDTSVCVHCGGEMIRLNGFWYHHSQFEDDDDPFDPCSIQGEAFPEKQNSPPNDD